MDDNVQVFKTECQEEREKRDLAIFNEYNALMQARGQSKTLVTAYLMKKYNVHSAGTIYLIRRRVEQRLNNQRQRLNNQRQGGGAL